MDTKTGSKILLFTRNTPQPQRQSSTQSKGLGKGFQANEPKKQAGVAILISNKIDFKLKSIRRDGDGYFMLITGTIHQKEVSILNIYVPNIKAPTYVKETLLKLRSHIRPPCTNSRRFQQSTLTNGQVNQTET